MCVVSGQSCQRLLTTFGQTFGDRQKFDSSSPDGKQRSVLFECICKLDDTRHVIAVVGQVVVVKTAMEGG